MIRAQIGQKWKTRSGHTAIIDVASDDEREIFPFGGHIIGVKDREAWGPFGHAYGDGGVKYTHDNDLLYLDEPEEENLAALCKERHDETSRPEVLELAKALFMSHIAPGVPVKDMAVWAIFSAKTFFDVFDQ